MKVDNEYNAYNPSSMKKYQWQCGPQNQMLSIVLLDGGFGVKLASGHEDNLTYQKKRESPPFCAKISLGLSTKEYSKYYLSINKKEASIVELWQLLLEERLYC